MAKREKIVSFIKDIKNDTSHTLDYLLNDEVEKTLSEKGIKVRKILAPILRFGYGYTTDYKLKVDSREKLTHSEKGKIFIVNHRQGDDMVLSAKAIA